MYEAGHQEPSLVSRSITSYASLQRADNCRLANLSSSTLRGFQLICVLVVTFGPSNEFEPYVRSFLQTSQIEGDPALRTIALREISAK